VWPLLAWVDLQLAVCVGLLGEGPAWWFLYERVVCCVFLLGNSVLEGLCLVDGSVVGRVSVADASLSLSLSLVEPASSR
jgi:hypothetical protein